MGDTRALTERLLGVIGSQAALDDAAFDALARSVFSHQFGCNAPYRQFCERRGVSPEEIGHWTEIPAVPSDAFKAAPLVCGDPAAAAAVFRTSGTTAGTERRGTHYVPDLSLYDAALRSGFARHLLPGGEGIPLLSLVPSADEVPDSSLSHMVTELMRDPAVPGSGYFVSGDFGIRSAALTESLDAVEADGAPVCLVGTAFALVHWLDEMAAANRRFRLPEGSRVMDTGGFKGRSREIGRGELYGALSRTLGVDPRWMVNEYGMTELGSQFYDGVAGTADPDPERRHHVGPAWVRTRATDPETLRILPHGEVGVLRHWDLANLGSVACIQTADLGITSEAGFRVLGRATGAEARGCSLAMEELLRALG